MPIVGDGEASRVRISASGKPVVVFDTEKGMVRVANVSLSQTGGGDWPAVDIISGEPLIEQCDISSNSLACVAIHGNACKPTVKRNRIFDGRKQGVHVYDYATGVIEDNKIFGNQEAGIDVHSSANPKVKNNYIYDGNKFGIWVHDDGQGLFEDNEVYLNDQIGLKISTRGRPGAFLL